MITLTTVIQKDLDSINAHFDKMLTTVVQKGMDDRNNRFDKMLKDATDHQDGTARMLHDFEHTTKIESDKAD